MLRVPFPQSQVMKFTIINFDDKNRPSNGIDLTKHIVH